MINLRNIRSLSDFQRNAKEHIKRLKKTGKPEVLTVNGQAELVVQDAASYQKLLDMLDRLDAIDAIAEGLRQADRGEGIPLEEFDAKMRKKYGIPRRS